MSQVLAERKNAQLPENVEPFDDLDFEFDLYQYEMAIEEYWKHQTLLDLICYSKNQMTFSDCVKLIKKMTRDGEEKYEEHLQDFDEVLLHVYLNLRGEYKTWVLRYINEKYHQYADFTTQKS